MCYRTFINSKHFIIYIVLLRTICCGSVSSYAKVSTNKIGQENSFKVSSANNEQLSKRALKNNNPFPNRFFPKQNYLGLRGTNNYNYGNQKGPRYFENPVYNPYQAKPSIVYSKSMRDE